MWLHFWTLRFVTVKVSASRAWGAHAFDLGTGEAEAKVNSGTARAVIQRKPAGVGGGGDICLPRLANVFPVASARYIRSGVDKESIQSTS